MRRHPSRRLLAAALLAPLLAAAAAAASLTVVSDYPLAYSGGRFVARIRVARGGSYDAFRVYVYAPVRVETWVTPPGAGNASLEPGGGKGGWLGPGVYRVVFRAAPGFRGEAEVWLAVAGGQPYWLLAALAAAAAAYAARGRLKRGLRRIASGLVYIIFRPDDALEHKLRAAIYEILRREGGASINRLARALGVYQNTVSWHLQVLERFGYAGHARIGRWTVYYYPGHAVEEWLSGFLAAETRWGAKVGREELRRLIAGRRGVIERLLEARALNVAKLRRILGV